jgi:NADH:ubiquinone oxidoreductase subunit F (NADH-binding)/(2Fe-2S) ferredoxin
MPKISIKDFDNITEKVKRASLLPDGAARTRITVHMGTCGIAAGAKKVMKALLEEIEQKGIKDLIVTSSGCAGLCSREPIATVELKEEPPVKYVELTPDKIRRILDEHVLGGKIVGEHALSLVSAEEPKPAFPLTDHGFFGRQTLIALRNRGLIDSDKIDEYIAREGYRALAKALTSMSPEEIIQIVKDSGLRGRGGAGFPTGLKWDFCRRADGEPKYIICNGDEGDPGAFMDRSIVEGDPHSVLEGMVIGAFAIGAHEGYIYIRNEYPLALQKLQIAIDRARDYGLLGENILDSGFDFDVTIQRGAGAFVCGEETSLIASIEGGPPEPRQRPPFPAQHGLWGKPTNINNVETWATIPPILLRGAEWFSSIGTEKSKGTKVFSLVGKIENSGLIEVPMGITLREIIFEIGGGMPNGKKFKAVQTGGPSGGCIPADLIDLPVDYESLSQAGSIMGSGGMIVMDEDTCVVDVARYFTRFTNRESCGKCSTCRDGSEVLLGILNRICEGEGREEDLAALERLGKAIRLGSLCGLGQTLPNPVLSTLRYFRPEYEMHIKEKKCPAGVCKNLIRYTVDHEKCTGCMLCVKRCPVDAVHGENKQPQNIDQSKCVKCGLCYAVCKFDAVSRT